MSKSELIQFMKANEIWAKRSMGQNFLVDMDVLNNIVRAAEIKPSDTILEIGPGLGVLTDKLSACAGKVIAIEKDDKFSEMLRAKFFHTNVEILNQDALEFDPSGYQLPTTGYKLVANIPYNVTSLIIRKFLETKNKPLTMVLLVQKEVAERIVAKPGDMSVLSVSVQFYAEAKIISIVKNTSFYPIPKVDSAVLKISNFKPAVSFSVSDFFRVVRFGFAAKRKTLENNLSAGLYISKGSASVIIKKAGLEPKIRAQDLSVEDWIHLYRHSGLDPESNIK